MRVFLNFSCLCAVLHLFSSSTRDPTIYTHKKDTFLCNIQEMSRGKINIMIRSCVTGCFIVAFLILKLNIA